ncbi:hypothetical protein PBY51_001216 [Eleginops maclovinus]|uniref:Uncharacterized protein n=1 Tax=Eleginops maclovinus TaxID=56733 RepID=A0AAN7XLE7_ELEMC|nr:hypothetical protein PBY51_001216 [Eleginops maclovinus]
MYSSGKTPLSSSSDSRIRFSSLQNFFDLFPCFFPDGSSFRPIRAQEARLEPPPRTNGEGEEAGLVCIVSPWCVEGRSSSWETSVPVGNVYCDLAIVEFKIKCSLRDE